MKKLLLLANIFTLFFLTSCSTDTDEFIVLDEDILKLSEALKESNLGVVKYDERTSIIKSKNEIQKFNGDLFEFNVVFSNLTDLGISTDKSKSNEVEITNPITGEFVIIQNVITLNDTTIVFDLLDNNGQLYESIEYHSEMLNEKCGWCWIVPIIVPVIVDLLDDDGGDGYDSNCSQAIDACGENGVQSVTIVDGGWFSDSSCTVICK